MIENLIILSVMIAVLVLTVAVVIIVVRKNPNLLVEKYDVCLKVALQVVEAVEQQHKAKTGEEKKEIAKETIKQIMAELGYTDISDTMIDMAIEAAVFGINAIRKQLEETEKGIAETDLQPSVVINI